MRAFGLRGNSRQTQSLPAYESWHCDLSCSAHKEVISLPMPKPKKSYKAVCMELKPELTQIYDVKGLKQEGLCIRKGMTQELKCPKDLPLSTSLCVSHIYFPRMDSGR
nr:testis-expressed protein 35 isoform X13 [Rattus norvegicus]